jgi:GTP-binding protein
MDAASERRIYLSMFNPDQISPASLAHAKRMFAVPATFVKSCTTWKQLPDPGARGEIAVVGRSNVGKSSLLNAVMNTRIVKTSSMPGFTKLINLFHIGGQLALLDLPGYGHNSNETQMNMVGGLLKSRQTLRNTCVLIEASHGIKEIDHFAMGLLEDAGVPYQVRQHSIEAYISKIV